MFGSDAATGFLGQIERGAGGAVSSAAEAIAGLSTGSPTKTARGLGGLISGAASKVKGQSVENLTIALRNLLK